MNQSEFEADLRQQGYQVFYGGLQAGVVNPDHTHDWDSRVMLLLVRFMLNASAHKALPTSPEDATL
jgi:hypothetical protein